MQYHFIPGRSRPAVELTLLPFNSDLIRPFNPIFSWQEAVAKFFQIWQNPFHPNNKISAICDVSDMSGICATARVTSSFYGEICTYSGKETISRR